MVPPNQRLAMRRIRARPAARAPRAATQPHHREAWLRIFVVGCSLPCDPPVGGHSCNGGMIPRFQPLVVRGGKAQSEQMFSGLHPKADFPILQLLPRPALRECAIAASRVVLMRSARVRHSAMSASL